MTKYLKNSLYITLGWVCVLLGIIGFILPLMPGTVFLIIALFFFAKSSPRFHQMLLDNRWFGKELRDWEANKSISMDTFRKASTVIIISITVSIVVLHEHLHLQIMLAFTAMFLVMMLWRLTKQVQT